MMFGSAESEHLRLTNVEIISDVFQPNVITIHQRYRQTHRRTDGRTERQTDDMRSQYRALHCTKVHRAVKRGGSLLFKILECSFGTDP